MQSTIKQKFGNCVICPPDSPEKPLITDKCQTHYWQSRAKPRKPKPRNPIPKFSAKELARLKEYRKVRDDFMKKHPYCQAKLNNCTKKATDLHHQKGRTGDLLSDERYFIALCRNCHSFIELHPEFSKENGFSENRL